MSILRRVTVTFALLLTLLGVPAAATAQQPPAAAPGQAAAAPAADAPSPAPEDPAVLAVLESNPQTPADLLRSVITLFDLGAPQEALGMFDQLQKGNPDEATLAALAGRFGSAELLRLAAKPEATPEIREFVEKTFAAANAAKRDPARLTELVAQLKDADPAVRRAAIVDLREAHQHGVAFLLNLLADDQRAEDQPALKQALAEMGAVAVEPLLATLAGTENARLQAAVIDVLGTMRAKDAMMFLVGPAVIAEEPAVRTAAQLALQQILGATPEPREATRFLHRQVKNHFQRIRPYPPDHEGYVELWTWDDKTRQAAPKKFLAEDVAILLAARLTPYLYALAPDEPEYREMHFTAQLEMAKMQQRYDQPLAKDSPVRAEAIASLSLEEFDRLLLYTIKQGYYGAATAACEILGEVATPEILIRPGGQPAPLVQALQQGDRRLRFAALTAIMKINPQLPYVGSSQVAEALGLFASTGGTRRAIVGHPQATPAQNVVALLGGLEYEAAPAFQGRQVLSLALNSADVDLIVLHSRIERPALRELVYQLRRDPRTAHLPIGVTCTLEDLQRMRDFAEGDPLMVAFPMPHDPAALAGPIAQLENQRGRNIISLEERRQQAALALEWIGQLAEHPATLRLYNLRRLAPQVQSVLHAPELIPSAATTLAQLGTADAQRALVELASQSAGSPEARQAAAAAFRASVAQHGILLTTSEILHQYDLYNASAGSDPHTQQLRASILDTIEVRTKGLDQPQPQ